MKLLIKFEPNWVYQGFPEYSAAMWTFWPEIKEREECASVGVLVYVWCGCVSLNPVTSSCEKL